MSQSPTIKIVFLPLKGYWLNRWQKEEEEGCEKEKEVHWGCQRGQEAWNHGFPQKFGNISFAIFLDFRVFHSWYTKYLDQKRKRGHWTQMSSWRRGWRRWGYRYMVLQRRGNQRHRKNVHHVWWNLCKTLHSKVLSASKYYLWFDSCLYIISR